MEQLPENVDLALILNPALDVAELLHAVCDELRVAVPPGEISVKVLVDRLNAYLLAAHAKGRRPVLMIDEAQNLRPEVLEQIRLLTNLETAKHKLLQIFLVGQPELRDLLARQELRQLGQRITARYHLEALDAAETADYVQHRLAVAGARHALFTPAALRQVHRLTGGVPRLVNILCDRALLGAYAGERSRVDTGIVTRAARELGLQAAGRPSLGRPAFTLAMLALALAGAAAVGYLGRSRQPPPAASPLTGAPTPSPRPQATAVVAEPVKPAPPVAKTPAVSNTEPLDGFVLPPARALGVLLARWGRRQPPSDTADPCTYAAGEGLRCRDGSGSWTALRRYDRPALLHLRAGGKDGYAVLVGLSGKQAQLEAGGRRIWVPRSQVEPGWLGKWRILWQPAPGGRTLIGPKAPPEAVHWLRETLDRVHGTKPAGAADAPWDSGLLQALKAFQTANGLTPDGIAGPETLVRLNSAAGLPGIPHLNSGP
jgi:general secretion pathway protein A